MKIKMMIQTLNNIKINKNKIILMMIVKNDLLKKLIHKKILMNLKT